MRYTKIHTQIWNDEKFIKLSSSQQRLFLYILTSPHSNLIGFYVLKKTYIQGDLEVLPKDLAKDLAKLCLEGLISYDDTLQVVLIHNWMKHNPITNPNQRVSAKKIVSELPKTYLFEQFKVLCEGLNEVLVKSLPKDLPKPCHPEEEEEEEEEEREGELETETVVQYLNEKTGKKFRPNGKQASFISARIKEGATIEDCKKVIDLKTKEWGLDAKMAQYLRPSTLFNSEKFESYLNSEAIAVETECVKYLPMAGEDGN